MKLVVVVLVGLMLFKSFESHAQEAKTPETAVVFDPLFWKDELKLTASQYQAIQNINREYYESIYRAADENQGNISLLQHKTTQLLQNRSEKIWNTFLPKQKRKWEKLSSSYSEDNSSFSGLSIKREGRL
jgi:hypothetical protein